ncbi:hypothetical protein J0H58_23855 [bacterium]|nr:hypothetical protein [bacterium]
MAERRSLVAGIEEIGGVDPDTARAFIVQERPRNEAKASPVRVVPDPVSAAPSEVEVDDSVSESEESGGEEKKRQPAAAQKRAKATPSQKRPHQQRLLATLLVPVTVRLRPEIASALKQASLQRQLNGEELYTQQDIVEEALVPWLQAEGLLD